MKLQNCKTSTDAITTLFAKKTNTEIAEILGVHRTTASRKRRGIVVLTHEDKLKMIKYFGLDELDQLTLFKM